MRSKAFLIMKGLQVQQRHFMVDQESCTDNYKIYSFYEDMYPHKQLFAGSKKSFTHWTYRTSQKFEHTS